MVPSRRSRAPRTAALAAAAALLLVGARPAHADWTVNGLGFGNVRVRIWCAPNAPPAAPNATATAGGFGASVTLPPPAVPGCNPATSGTSTNSTFWSNQTTLVAGAGDHVAAPPSDDLFLLVTPTLPLATVSVFTVGEFAGSFAFFSGFWSGTDPGTAASLEWWDVSIPGAATMITSLLRIGPWAEPIDIVVPVPGGLPENLEIRGSAVATSVLLARVPEPASIALVATGLLGLGVAARRRRG